MSWSDGSLRTGAHTTEIIPSFPDAVVARRLLILSLSASAAVLVAVSAAIKPVPRLIWNASASVPPGLYWLSSYEFELNDLVLAKAPIAARALAAERGYLPTKASLIKRVVALSGDEICAQNGQIFINAVAVAARHDTDSMGRPMPTWTGCRVLGDEVFLLLGDVPTSFDGRYFGPIPRSTVAGKLTPLWTR